jgi:membrane protease subunit (stomatin/prohibitin family)
MALYSLSHASNGSGRLKGITHFPLQDLLKYVKKQSDKATHYRIDVIKQRMQTALLTDLQNWKEENSKENK